MLTDCSVLWIHALGKADSREKVDTSYESADHHLERVSGLFEHKGDVDYNFTAMAASGIPYPYA